MSLSVGSRVGQYELTGLLGEGGMGRVFQARDMRLERNVAIKVLPEALANDPDRVARFEREAKVLASLSHPHIASLFGIEQHDGELLLVMQLIDGETIADRLQRGPMPIAEAIAIATQIAEALESAHEAGIVHRDLKPANIKIDRDGRVKVLDFGLAKAMEPPASSAQAANSPTLSLAATHAGIILGTAAYMAPEQAKGGVVDHRSDVFSLGCVIFEMIAGRQVFQGETAAEILASVLIREPDFSLLPSHLDQRIVTLLQRCLDKNPKQRWQSVGDVRLELQAIARSPAPIVASVAPALTAAPLWRRALPLVVTALIAAATAAAAAWMLKPARLVTPVQFSIDAPQGAAFTTEERALASAAIAPDGRTVAFTARDETGKRMIWTRRIDALVSQPLAGTEGADLLFWSPDSQFIAFFADRKLRKVSASGGQVETLCDAPAGRGGTWSREGTILFAGAPGAQREGRLELRRVPAAGGVPAVVQMDAVLGSPRFPSFLPDGRHYLVYMSGANTIRVGSLDSTTSSELVSGVDSGGVWSSSGHILYGVDGTLYARPFDHNRLAFTGEPVPVAQNVGGTVLGHVTFSVSDNGSLAYGTGTRLLSNQQLFWVNRKGEALLPIGQPGAFKGLDLSPDQKHLVFHRDEARAAGDVWVLDVERGSATRLTNDGAQSHSGPGVWLADRQQVVFGAQRSNKWLLIQKPANGLGAETVLYESDQRLTAMGTSPDAKHVIFQRQSGAEDIWVLALDGKSKPREFQASSSIDSHPQVSPNGKWLAYGSNEGGTGSGAQIYLRSFPEGSEKRTVSIAGGRQPRWRGDGRELFFVEGAQVGGTGSVMAVDVQETGSTLQLGQPKKLFDNDYFDMGPDFGGNYHTYVVSADGQRFLIPRAGSAKSGLPPSQPLVVIVNWASTIAKP